MQRYIERDDFRKVQKLLQKCPELKDDERIQPLHSAAALGHADCIKVLLKNGFDVEEKDAKNRFPLHLALKYYLRKRNSSQYLMEELIAPLLTKSRRILDAKDVKGISCRSLLDRVERIDRISRVKDHDEGHESDDERKDSWQDRLRAEAEDDFRDEFGSTFHDHRHSDSSNESYDEWADRIYHEYHRKHGIKRERVKAKQVRKAASTSKAKELRQPQLFNAEESRKKKMISLYRAAKSKLESCGGNERISASDIPFNASKSGDDDEKIAEIIIESCFGNESELRILLRNEIRFWHPDKFVQKFKAKFVPNEEELIVEKVTRISQALLKYGKK